MFNQRRLILRHGGNLITGLIGFGWGLGTGSGTWGKTSEMPDA
jgi:hypothetical protein